MSVEQLEQSVLQLTPGDRRRFLDWFLANEGELLAGAPTETGHEWKQEIRQRVAEIESGAVKGVPGEEVAAKIRRLVGKGNRMFFIPLRMRNTRRRRLSTRQLIRNWPSAFTTKWND